MTSNIPNIDPNRIVTQSVDDAIEIVVDELVELAANPIETVLNQTFFNHRNKTGRNIENAQGDFNELRKVLSRSSCYDRLSRSGAHYENPLKIKSALWWCR